MMRAVRHFASIGTIAVGICAWAVHESAPVRWSRTLNEVRPTESRRTARVDSSTPCLELHLVNNLPSDRVRAYLSGLDANGTLIMLGADGRWYHPRVSNNTDNILPMSHASLSLSPRNTTKVFRLPESLLSARLWVADGELEFSTVRTQQGLGLVEPSVTDLNDPNHDIDWGFMELTYSSRNGLYVNLSFVDFVGMALGMRLRSTGNRTSVVKGIAREARSSICRDLCSQADLDGQPWRSLCRFDTQGRLVRVISPAALVSIDQTAFSSYWTQYVKSLYEDFANVPLTVDTQSDSGTLRCTGIVSNRSDTASSLRCEQDGGSYMIPSAGDVFGCSSGPFALQTSDSNTRKAVVPRICAALNRGTFSCKGGNVQPGPASEQYYAADVPKNWYSAITHRHEIDGRGYAFPYDDVVPDGGFDVAGVLADPTPGSARTLQVFAGGFNEG